MPDLTTAYFDDVIARATVAAVVPREAWSDAEPNKCHLNCEAFVARVVGFQLVRGWLVLGGHFCIPRSVVRNNETGILVDITPEPGDSRIPFVEHLRSEQGFLILRQGRDGGYAHPPAIGLPSGYGPADPFHHDWAWKVDGS
ncbi:MAG: hypothetical protein GEU95_18340 [Rhizobiales bacterium]|nr:hypothetical protein [Hyphomicrobiales bacterium]